MQMKMHFFATSHGKGVMDGQGGTVKRAVWRDVKSGEAAASTPQAFYEVAVARNPTIDVIFISKEMISVKREELDAYWQDAVLVPHTHKIHTLIQCGKEH